MARPKDAVSEETWNKIVAAAREELTHDDRGSIDLSMRQVAARSGVSLGTIHYYFPTKEALLESCLDAYYESLRALVEDLAGQISSTPRENGPEVIGGCLRRVYRFALSERPRLKIRALTNMQRGHLHPQRETHVRGPYLELFTRLLTRLVDVNDEALRMAIQTMSFVVMHYVLLTDAELEQITCVGGEAGRAKVEDHIVHTALRLVFTTPPQASGLPPLPVVDP